MELVLENQTYKFPAYNIFKACIPDPSNRDIINPYYEEEYFTLHAYFTIGDISAEIKIRVTETIIFKILLEKYYEISAGFMTLWCASNKNIYLSKLVNLVYTNFYENIEKYIDFRKTRKYGLTELIINYEDKKYIFHRVNNFTDKEANFYNLVMYALNF